MIVDKETYTIDMVPISHCASFDQDVLLFSPDDSKLKTGKVKVLNYLPKYVCIAPEIPKGSAMIHPTGVELSHGKPCHYGIVVGPHELYRYICGRTVGDILG